MGFNFLATLVLLCSVGFLAVSGQSSYVSVKTYLNSACTGTVGTYALQIVNYCYPVVDSKNFQRATVANGQVVINEYYNGNCTGDIASQTNVSTTACVAGENGLWTSASSTLVTSTDFPVSNAFVATTYATSCGQGIIVERFAYNPAACFPNVDGDGNISGYLSYPTCTKTGFTLSYWANSGCTVQNGTTSLPAGCVANSSLVDECYSAPVAPTTPPVATTTSNSSTGAATTGAATTGTTTVTATITIRITVTFANISAVNVSSLQASFAATLGVNPSAVNITFQVAAKRATNYVMVVNVQKVVPAGTNSATIAAAALTSVNTSLNTAGSPLAQAIQASGATNVGTPTATATVPAASTTTTTAAATTSTSGTGAPSTSTTGSKPVTTTTAHTSSASSVVASSLLVLAVVAMF